METREEPQVLREDSNSSSRPSFLSDDGSLTAGKLEMESMLSENSSHFEPGDLSLLENSEMIYQNSIPPSNNDVSPSKSSTEALSNDYHFKKPFNPDLKVLSPFTSRKKIIKNNVNKENNPKRKVSVDLSNISQDSFDEDFSKKIETGRRVSVNFSLDNSESDDNSENNASKPLSRRVSVKFPDNLSDDSNASSLSLISEEEERILCQGKKGNNKTSLKTNSKFPPRRVSVKFSFNESDEEISSSLSSPKTGGKITKKQNTKTPEVDISQNSSTIGLSSPFRKSPRRSSARVSSVFDDTGILDDSLLARIDNAITCNRTNQSNICELSSFGKNTQNPVDRSSDADLSDVLPSTSSSRNIPFTPNEPVDYPENKSSPSEGIPTASKSLGLSIKKSRLTKNLDITDLDGIENSTTLEKELSPHETKRSRTSKSLRSSNKKSNLTNSLDFTDYNQIESDTSSVISPRRSLKGAKSLGKRVSVKFSLNDIASESDTPSKKNSTPQKSVSLLSENGSESNDENETLNDTSLVKSTEKESLPVKAKQTHSSKSHRSSGKKSNLTNSLDFTNCNDIESNASSVISPRRSLKGANSLGKRVSVKFSLNDTISESDTPSKKNSTPQKSVSLFSENGSESNDENETMNDASLVKSTEKESLHDEAKQTYSSKSLRSSGKKSNLTNSLDVEELDVIESDTSSVISPRRSLKGAKSLGKRVSVNFSLNDTDSKSDTPSKKNSTPQKSVSLLSENGSESNDKNETMNDASLVKSTEKESLPEKAKQTYSSKSLRSSGKKSNLTNSLDYTNCNDVESDASSVISPRRSLKGAKSLGKRVSVNFSLNDTDSKSDTPSKKNSTPQKSVSLLSENGSESNDENETMNDASLVKSTEKEPLHDKAKQTYSSKSLRSSGKKSNLTKSLDVEEFDGIESDTSSVISPRRSLKGAKSLGKRVSVNFSLNDTDSESDTPSKKKSTPQKSKSLLSENGCESNDKNETLNGASLVKSTEKESLPEKAKQTHSTKSLRSSSKKSNLTNSLDFTNCNDIEIDASSVISPRRSLKGAKPLGKRVSVKISLNNTDSESEMSSKKNSTSQKSVALLSENGSESDDENETMNDASLVKSTEKESLPEKAKQTHSTKSLRSSSKKSNLTNSLDFTNCNDIEIDASSVISPRRSLKDAKSLGKRVSVNFSLNDTDSESDTPSKKNSTPQKSISILSGNGSESNYENKILNDASLVKSKEKESLPEKAIQALSSKSLDMPQRKSCLKKSVNISEFDGIESDDSCLNSPLRPTRSENSPAKRVSVKFSLNDIDSESVILSKKNSTPQKSMSVLSENDLANRDENKTDIDVSSAKSLGIPKRKSCLKRSLSQDFNIENSEQLRNRSVVSDTRRLSVKFNDLDNDCKSSCLGKPSLSMISEDNISFTRESFSKGTSGTNKPERRVSVKFDLDDLDNEGNSILNNSKVSGALNKQTDGPNCNLMMVQNLETPEKNDWLSSSVLSSTAARRKTRQSLARASSVFDDTKNIDDSLLAAMDSVLLKRKQFKKSLSTSLPNPSITTSLAADDKSINDLADLTSYSEVIMDISVETKNKKRAKSKKSLSTSLQNPIINTSSPVAHDKSINVVRTLDKTTYSEVIMEQSFPLNSESKNMKKSKKSLSSSLQNISEDANASKSRFEISTSTSRSSLKSDPKILNTGPDTSPKLDNLELPNPSTFPATDENSINIVASPDKTSYSEVVMEQDISYDKSQPSNKSLSTSVQNRSMNTSVSNSRFDKSTSDCRPPSISASKIGLDEAPQLDKRHSLDLQILLTSPSATVKSNSVLDKTSDSEVIIKQCVPSDTENKYVKKSNLSSSFQDGENTSVSECHVENSITESRTPLKSILKTGFESTPQSDKLRNSDLIPSVSPTADDKNINVNNPESRSPLKSLKHGSDVANLTPNKSYNLRKLSSSVNQLKEDSRQKRKTTNESLKLNEIAKSKIADMEISSKKVTPSSMTGIDLNMESEECPLMIPSLSETSNPQLGTGQLMQSSEESLKLGSSAANLTPNKSYNLRKLSSSVNQLKEDSRLKRKTTNESLKLNEVAKSKDTHMELSSKKITASSMTGIDLKVEFEECPLIIPSLSETSNSQLGTGQVVQSSEEYISKNTLDARNSLSGKPYNLRESSVFNESQNLKITRANNLKMTSTGSKIHLEPNVIESELCSLNFPSQPELLASQRNSVNLTMSFANKSSEDVGKLILEARREENEKISSKSTIVPEKQASVDEIMSDKTSDSNMLKDQEVPNKKRKRMISPSLQRKSDKASLPGNQLDNSNTESRSSEKSILKTKSDASRHSRVSPIPSTSHISGDDPSGPLSRSNNVNSSDNKKHRRYRESSSESRRTNRSLRDYLSAPDHLIDSVSIPRTSKEHDFVEPDKKVSSILSVKNSSDSAKSETATIDSPRHSLLDVPSGIVNSNNEVVNYNANEMSQKSSTISLRISSGDSVSENQIDSVSMCRASKEQDFAQPDEEVSTRSSLKSILINRSEFAKSKATIESSRHSRRVSPILATSHASKEPDFVEPDAEVSTRSSVKSILNNRSDFAKSKGDSSRHSRRVSSVPSTFRASKECDFVEPDEKIATRSSVKSILKNVSESDKSKTTIDSSKHSRHASPVPSTSRSPKKHSFVEPNTGFQKRKSSSNLSPSATSLKSSSRYENDKTTRNSSVKSMGMPNTSSVPNFFIVPDIPFRKPSLKRALIDKSEMSPKTKEQKTNHNSSYSSYLEELNNNKRKNVVFQSTPKHSSRVEEFNNNQTKRLKPTSDVVCQTSDPLINVKKSTMNRYSSAQTDEAYNSTTFNERKRRSSSVPFKQRVKFILSTNDSTGKSYRSSSMMSSLTSRRESSQGSHFQHVRFRDRPSLIDKSNFENDSSSDESGIEPLRPARREPAHHERRVSFRNRLSNVGSNSESINDSLSRMSSQFVAENVSQASGITTFNSEHLTDIEELSSPIVTNHSPAEILPTEPNSINNKASFVNPMEKSQVSELCLPDDFSILNRPKLKNIPPIDCALINCDDLRYDPCFHVQQRKMDTFPDKWVSKKFIEYLTSKLQTSCQGRASAAAQHLISLFCAAVNAVEILNEPKDIDATTLLLRKCLVKYHICTTTLEYYLLLWNYTPQKFRNKIFSQVKSKMGDPIIDQSEILNVIL